MALDDYYDFRQQMVNDLMQDLVGPGNENEVIEDAPITRYASGILYPRLSGTLDASEDIDVTDDDDGGSSDPPVALANVRYPSSMGMTFAVDSGVTDKIRVQVRGARYVALHKDLPEPEAVPNDSVQPRRSGGRQRWQRIPLTPPPLELNISRSTPGERVPLGDEMQLFYRVRRANAIGTVAVTLVLLNHRTSGFDAEARNSEAVFQPEIEVTVPEAGRGAFIERAVEGGTGADEDIRSYRLLYRHAREFAVGHGVSVRWVLEKDSFDRATLICTTFTPEYEVRAADSNPAIDVRATEMKYLVGGKREELIEGLYSLCDGYEEWVGERYDEVKGLDGELRETALSHLRLCKEAAERMRGGVNLLGTDDEVWEAFRLSNRAMLQQRARTVWLRQGHPTEQPAEGSEHRWRPFQLAFILLCLEGVAKSESSDRDIADLLWFPTGGGKTEAYLGLIAFTVFLQRLRRPQDGGGVTALMRYTLRLLTIQQFERAALLMCCCERIRRERLDLGTESISIGLWVGQDATPNTLDDARTALNKLHSGSEIATGNPIQLHSCPWCGTPLDHRNYWIASGDRRLVISCRREECLFGSALPVYLVDEDVYRHRPTLIISTVDKFAALPWREETATLFNLPLQGQHAGPGPELIIQDELHLISGPLGTLTGLYETAIDILCTRNGIRPKVIASTATIRRAGQQASGLFNRPIRQFPPPGLDARDSYFAVETPRARRGTRMYVGLMAPGTSHTTLLVRAYAALLQRCAEQPAPPEIKDPYWTLVGYFTSLRVLGGARMQVQDDVNDRMELLARQSGHSKREVEHKIELTSREPSRDIPQHLKHMTVNYPDPMTLDVILATNMISVGVDIDRLGLMAVMGQPQSTSEYIQSTSRVGRQFPGLVVVLFNAARSRDRSHYESFVTYHSALYRQVESTSVTPFSARARDRGLHAVLVALARMLIPDLRSNDAARQIATLRNRLQPIEKLIVERVRQVAPDEEEATRAQLEELLNNWTNRAGEIPGLVYRNYRDSSRALLTDAKGDEATDGEAFPTLWSLRDVDRESHLYLIREQ